MMESAAPRLWVPLSAGILAVMAVAAVLVGLRGGSFPRSVLLPRRMMHQEPVSDFTSGMRFDPNGPDPLTATAIVRGVPTQRMNAPERGFSQQGEDLIIWEQYHYGMRDGVFLEMGALDGYRFSNTLFYEAFLGWTGLLIEPGVPAFKRLTANRPNATKVNAAVCDRAGTVHFLEGVMGRGEIDGIEEFMPDSFKAFWHKNVTQERSTEVPCVPLRQLLAEAGLKHVNVFSLDVEGAELAVLRTIDFAAVTFDVVFVETSGHDPTKDAQSVELLVRHGYIVDQVVNGSTWFLREGFSPSRQGGH